MLLHQDFKSATVLSLDMSHITEEIVNATNITVTRLHKVRHSLNARTTMPHLLLLNIKSKSPFIDSLNGFTFRNQLISIMLVMATGQHLQIIVIWGPPNVSNEYQKMLKLDDAFFERMTEKM